MRSSFLFAALVAAMAAALAACGVSATQTAILPTLPPIQLQAAPAVTQAPVSTLAPISTPTWEPTATPKPTATPVPTSTPRPTSTPSPTRVVTPVENPTPTVNREGSWATPNLEVSVVPAALKVGETATVTARVTGPGGLPNYYLNLDPKFFKIKTGDSSTEWTVEAVAIGATSISVSMTYETQVCLDGNCFFNFTGTSSPSVTVTVSAGEKVTAGGPGERPKDTAVVEESWPAPVLEISVVPATLRIGETATVTVRTTGRGGFAEYYLDLDSNFLKANSPNQVLHNTYDEIPQWTIEAVNIATTSLSVNLRHRTKICLDGDCYFNIIDTRSPSVVVKVVPAESATYTLQTSVDPFFSGGTITQDPLPASDETYLAGTVVTLTASPSGHKACNSTPYWSFVGWTGALQGSTPAVEISMDSSKTVSAVFREFFPPNC
jgi:hypothetical protein